MTDKDSQLIFENYRKRVLLNENFEFDESKAKIDLQRQDSNQSYFFDLIKNPIDKLLIKARDPKSILDAISTSPTPKLKTWVSLFLNIKNYFEEGETTVDKQKLEELCQQTIEESKKSVDTILDIIYRGKKIDKSLEDVQKYLNVEILKIKENLTLILKQKTVLQKILDKEFQKATEGKKIWDPRKQKNIDLDVDRYILIFSDYLVEKGITNQAPKNIEGIVNSLVFFVNKSFNGSTPTSQITQSTYVPETRKGSTPSSNQPTAQPASDPFDF
jgi:hypothetical protein